MQEETTLNGTLEMYKDSKGMKSASKLISA
jgi:hypothetical protein